MAFETLRITNRRVIGLKQTTKAVETGRAQTVFLASDAEEHVLRDLKAKCQERGVEVVHVDTMVALGKACGIEVGAATAAVVKAEG